MFLLISRNTILVNLLRVLKIERQRKKNFPTMVFRQNVLSTCIARLEVQVLPKQISAEDVCDKQNICKPDLFQNYETTMGAPLGDTVYSYHLSTLLHASPLI